MHLAVDRRVVSLRGIGVALLIIATALFVMSDFTIVAVVLLLAGLALVSRDEVFLIFGTLPETEARLKRPLQMLSLAHESSRSGISLPARGVSVRLRPLGPVVVIRFMMKRPPEREQRFLFDLLLKSQRAILKII